MHDGSTADSRPDVSAQMKGSTVLTITRDAAHLVRTLTEQARIPDRGGLRIAVNPDTDSLSMGLADAPETSDAVIAHDGALVFVSEPAAQRMRGLTLCAEVTPIRSVFFLEAA